MSRAEELMQDMEKRKTMLDMERSRVRDLEEEKERANANACREILSAYGGTLMWTNGYVYEFIWGDTQYTLCDQESRVVGRKHRILNEREAEFLRMHEHELGAELKEEFRYQGVNITGSITRAIKEILNGGHKWLKT